MPLHIAAQNGHDAAIEALLSCGTGADVNGATATTHATPLMLAAWRGRVSTVRLLLARGANPNLQTKKGRTALQFAQDAQKMLKLASNNRNPDPQLLETTRILARTNTKSK